MILDAIYVKIVTLYLTILSNLCRLNINNVDMKANKEKRNRAINYWKERVIQDFLPPIDQRKQ
jgi:hypothetical protein